MVSKGSLGRQLYSGRIVAIDPGVKASGVACFDGGSLVSAFWARESGARSMEAEVILRASSAFGFSAGEVVAVVEEPITVRGRAFRGSTESLLKLSQSIGALRAMLQSIGTRVELTSVRAWKGNVPTEALQERLLRKLDEDEKLRIEWPAQSYAHNIVDAISLGLWALGR